ncbi:MAG: hypothetical protein H6709_12265 [Kofleriaceae bacterium]|nr:hypothetical protein [Kofleriaceae bacterium]MCB9572852.1 hypothetical protein [Kofleriaceae bacterium]
MSTTAAPPLPDWAVLEDRLVTELRLALATLADDGPAEPLAAIVLWADPYKGWYEVLADTRARNAEGAAARNARMLALLPELAAAPDRWKTAMTTARQIQALDFDPQYGDYALADDPIHTFEVSYDAFVRSERYAELNQGGEDGWLEGHVRYVIAGALARLVAEGAFAAVATSLLRIGYAYPDSGNAIIVAHVQPAAT